MPDPEIVDFDVDLDVAPEGAAEDCDGSDG